MLKSIGVCVALFASAGIAFSHTPPSRVGDLLAESMPQLGCYGYPIENPTHYFCLREQNVLLSEVQGYKEGFGECAKYQFLTGNRISFTWSGSSEGTLARLDDITKPVNVDCAVRASSGGGVTLQHCEMAGT